MKNIPLLKVVCIALVMFVTAIASAQSTNTPTVTSNSPTNVTYRTTMTITGTNFASGSTVNFYVTGATGTTVAALSTTYVSSTQLTVVVPAVVASGSAASTKFFSVSKVVSGVTYTSTAVSYTYIPPAQTPSASVVDRIITNYNGYWSSGTSGSGYTTNATQPDRQHSLMAFRYNGTLYSTGSETEITSVLASSAATGTYTAGNWRAIPVNNISGNVPTNASVYVVLASLIDGSATTSVYNAPSVVGLSARDVLIDGTRGLGLGTGLTNLPSTSPLTFSAGSILENKAGDNVPDIMVTQVADPTTSAFTTYCFVDVNGNIVGKPVEINMSSISKLGTYKSDFFTLTSGQSFNTATINGVGNPGGNTRDIRILAYKLSDFGITEVNRSQVVQFKVLTNGTDDMAFMAYNRDSFTIPAPEITSQPVNKVVCPGGSATFSVEIASLGTGTENPTYQWEKNGVAISNSSNVSGATTATLTITNVTTADYGIYRCVVTNTTGAAFSNMAYLNSVFLTTSTSAATCQGTQTTLSSTADGNTPQYQWYIAANNGATNSNTGGTAISGATASNYNPPVTVAGTKYYYVLAYPSGYSCAPATSVAMPVTVYGASAAGTITTPQSTICSGNTTILTVSGYTGNIQWQQSADNSTWADISGAVSSTYTTAALTATNYYRVIATNGTCGSVTSSVTTVTVTPLVNGGSLPTSQAVCNGDLPGALTLTGYTGSIVRWERSATSDFASYTTIDNTTATLSGSEIGTLSATTYFRALVQSGSCGTAYSTVATFTVGSTTWDGTSWSNGFPSGGTAVIFNASYTATSSFAACTLTVQNNAQVVVPSGYTATVQNWVNVAAGSSLTFNNNAALVQVNDATNTGNITLHKTTNPLYRLDYTLWSSPVDGQNLYNFSPATASSRFYEYKYDYTGTEYANLYWPISSANNFVTAKGFLIRMPNVLSGNVTGTTNGGVTTPSEYADGTGNYLYDGIFTGTPHNGTITYPLSTEGNLYTAIGNPYPSPISVIDFFNANGGAMDISSGIYLWRKRNNYTQTSYAVITQAGYVANPTEGGGAEQGVFFGGSNLNWTISQAQGFFVKTKSGVTNPQITFTNSMRRATPGASIAFFKSAATAATVSTNSPSRFWLNITGDNNAAGQTMIGYFNEATFGLDYGYDAKAFAENTLTLYTLADETKLAIQARPGFEVNDVVPMGFNTATAGTFTIALDHVEGIFSSGQKIYLRDNVEGIVRDLTQHSYAFTTEAGSFNTRFEVFYTTETALGTENPTLVNNNVIVYSEDATIGINSGSALMNSITIYDVRGRKLYSKESINATDLKVSSLTAQKQVLIVEVNTVNGKVSKKILF